jgi:hypothetical protein
MTDVQNVRAIAIVRRIICLAKGRFHRWRPNSQERPPRAFRCKLPFLRYVATEPDPAQLIYMAAGKGVNSFVYRVLIFTVSENRGSYPFRFWIFRSFQKVQPTGCGRRYESSEINSDHCVGGASRRRSSCLRSRSRLNSPPALAPAAAANDSICLCTAVNSSSARRRRKTDRQL